MHPQHYRQRVGRSTLAAARVERGHLGLQFLPRDQGIHARQEPRAVRGLLLLVIFQFGKSGCVSMSSSSPSCKLYNYNMAHPQPRLIQTFPSLLSRSRTPGSIPASLAKSSIIGSLNRILERRKGFRFQPSVSKGTSSGTCRLPSESGTHLLSLRFLTKAASKLEDFVS